MDRKYFLEITTHYMAKNHVVVQLAVVDKKGKGVPNQAVLIQEPNTLVPMYEHRTDARGFIVHRVLLDEGEVRKIVIRVLGPKNAILTGKSLYVHNQPD